jgi:hypothetical protein
MSYAGKESRAYRASTSTAGRFKSESGGRVLERERNIASRTTARSAARRPDLEVETDWQQVTIFAVGALVGAALGAGAALLFAPESGEEARFRLARRGRRLRARTADAWDDLRDELHYAAHRGRRKLGRALRRRREHRREEEALDD